MWWIKKKKKCKCPCHYRSVGFKNPPDVHCPECEKYNKEARKRRLASPQHKRSKIIHKIDEVTSLIVRIRGEWKCIKCQRVYPPVISKRTGLPAQNLMTASHYFSRGKFGTRWELENQDPMCIFDHQKVENNKKEIVEGFNYEEYMKNKLGSKRFEVLRIKSEMRAKYSITDLEFLLDDFQKQLRTTIDLYGTNCRNT